MRFIARPPAIIAHPRCSRAPSLQVVITQVDLMRTVLVKNYGSDKEPSPYTISRSNSLPVGVLYPKITAVWYGLVWNPLSSELFSSMPLYTSRRSGAP
jgi:hypothetical protein